MVKWNIIDSRVILALGELPPVPWKVPRVFRHGGCLKDPRLIEWQEYVASAARLAWGPYEPTTNPVSLKLVFSLPFTGNQQGLVMPSIKLNAITEKWTKRGKAQSDLTNLTKAVEDALNNIIYVDDVLVRHKEEMAVYAPANTLVGVTVTVHILDATNPVHWPKTA